MVKFKVDQETINFVIQQVDSRVLRDNIINDLCERYGISPHEAEKLVSGVENTHKANPGLIPFFPKIGVGILIIAAIYFLEKGIRMRGVITIQGFDFVILFAVMCTQIMLIGFILHSKWQNSIKETIRCSRCGYLANYKGNENSILTPRYEESTYYTLRILVKTWQEVLVSLWLDTIYHEGPEWDDYFEFEITEFCRSCKQVRREYRKVKKVEHRYPKDPDIGP
jgi:hypothetical protein